MLLQSHFLVTSCCVRNYPGGFARLCHRIYRVVRRANCASTAFRSTMSSLPRLPPPETPGSRLRARAPFLDSWVSEWALGYPIWRSYQPLPHAAAAALLRLFRGIAEPDAIFADFYYFLLIAFPVSVYIGARLLGLPPPAAGLAALLAFAPSANGDLHGYRVEFTGPRSQTGLYTQLFALHFMVLAVGMTARALDEGERRKRDCWRASCQLTAFRTSCSAMRRLLQRDCWPSPAPAASSPGGSYGW